MVMVFGCNVPQKVGKTDTSEEICENGPCELLSQVALGFSAFSTKKIMTNLESQFY